MRSAHGRCRPSRCARRRWRESMRQPDAERVSHRRRRSRARSRARDRPRQARGPARRRAGRAQGQHHDARHHDDRRVADAAHIRAAVRRDRGRPARGRGRRRDGQDELRRVRDGIVDRELRVRALAQSVESRITSRAVPAADRPSPSPPACRRSRSAPIPAAPSGSLRRSAALSA